MEQTNSIRIRKSVSKAELKSRLYDKGISVQTMPSVKRPIPENVKPYAAKLNSKPPVYAASSTMKPPPYMMGSINQGTLQTEENATLTQKPSLPQLGSASKHLKSMSSEVLLRTQDKFLKAQNQEENDFELVNNQQLNTIDHQGFRPQSSTDNLGQLRGLNAMTKSISNPQFTSLNMAPYSRPQTQAFGFRGHNLQQDPSKKAIRASEEVTSITGIKTMTPLGPSAVTRPKTSQQDLLQKRSQSNKVLKRKIIGGRSEADEKRRQLANQLKDEDEDRRMSVIQSSPSRKPNEKVVAGMQEYTEEILRSHYLMHKIRVKEYIGPQNRPGTSEGIIVYGGVDPIIPNPSAVFKSQRESTSDLRNRPLSNKIVGSGTKNYFNQSRIPQDYIEEQPHEDEQHEEQEHRVHFQQSVMRQTIPLDQTKTNQDNSQAKANQNTKQLIVNKWNDLDKLITLLQNQPDDDGYFIYLKPSDINDPYDLQPLIEPDSQGKSSVSGAAISKKSSQTQKTEKFFTLSKKGITTYINDEPVEYISLTDWLIERNFYQQISDKRFFKQFRRWKIIRMWRRNILQKKREEVKNNLSEKLFMLDDIFGSILMEHRRICQEMQKYRIIDLNQPGQEVLQLADFASNQTKQREQIVTKIEEHSEACRNKFRQGINQVLEDLRQKINDQNEDEETQKKDYIGGRNGGDVAKEKKSLNSDPVFEQLGFKHNLKYGPRSKLRRACSRFLRFSYLLDFIALEALSNIYVESVKDTCKKLKDLTELQPDYELRPARSAFGDQPMPKKATSSSQLALFSVNGIFEENEIPNEYYTIIMVEKFDPPPVGHSKEEDFDPVVHLELQEENEENLEQEDMDLLAEDENANKVERIKVISLNKLWLNINPQKSDFLSLLNECFQEGLECLKHFERWSRHEDLLPYVKVLESWDDKVCDEWDPPDDNNLNCDDWLQENYWFMNQSDLINQYLTEAFENVSTFFLQLEPFLQAFWENKQLGNFEIIENEKLKNPTDVIPLLLQRFNDQKTNFENLIPQNRELGMIRVNLNDIKNKLTPSPKDCFNKLKKMLPSMVRRRIDQYKQWLIKQIESISKGPTNVETYVKQIQALEYIDKNYQQVKDKIDLNNQIYTICLNYEIESKEEKNKKFVDEVYTIMNNLNQAIVMANDSADKRKEQMKTKISNKIPKLKNKVDSFMQVILQERFLDVNSNIYEILKEIDQLEKTCASLVEKSKKVQEFQKTLDMDVSPFDYVEDARVNMLYRSRLWRSLNEWKELIESWKNSPFELIDVSEITVKADMYYKIVIQCERNLPQGSTAVAKLKKLVFDFRETMPIVEALGNKYLREQHWEEIKIILNIPEYPLESMQFNLGQLIEFNVANFQEEIINVSVTATQEFNLRNQLDEIEKLWKETYFKTTRHKDKDIQKLTELEDIQQKLDESLTNISNIIGSRYVKRLQQDAELMQQKLNLIFDTLEQWKDFQRNWIYLENIFASPDIKKNNPKDSQEFETINRWWSKTMKQVHSKPNVMKNCETPQKYLDFLKYNEALDKIQKNLEAYLEQKRMAFPRFYFLSNDELLQILANAQDVKAVEKHINKCFDNIAGLMLQDTGSIPDIIGIISSEREQVEIGKVRVRTSGVEVWMKTIETNMKLAVQKRISDSYKVYADDKRKEWVLSHIGQAIATTSQLLWTMSCEIAINEMEENPLSLQDLVFTSKVQLQQLTELICGNLSSIHRKILVSLITTDVHARDIIETLAAENVQSQNDFLWQQQLRYYLTENEDSVVVRQVNATIAYGNEYMGATSRLVITPLTDRCWITITGAMHIKLGAAPAGPAGTGKTESTKDLAKALGIYCVVFNCSDQIEYKMMARLFSGLVQSGAWACLDEFNRIDVEVLSVIAQQLLDIKEAKVQKKEKFIFNGVEMDLKQECGVFVTMNPGYAGRTELPDNLKVLFRPVSMMVPNYGLIAEIMLFAEGFQNAKILSTKMVQLYKLASEQLSQQDHYDFGMRAVKSVLVMAGTLKRAYPDSSEDVVLIRAMRDSNIPKFLADDLPLFSALIQDLFPGIEIPSVNYGELQDQIEKSLDTLKLQNVPEFITKVIQLFDTFNVRFGVMIVGPTGGGKTTCYKVLAHAMTVLRNERQSRDQRFQETKFKVLNPKSISMGELYGEENIDTKEWTDGLASKIIREFAKDETERRNWCVFDGPVDALWIENMNTVLDDNLTLCLANGERIKLNWQMRMLFEVQDLAVASPATVSRCGMVYMTPSELGWKPYVISWIDQYIRKHEFLHEEAIASLTELFMMYVDDGLNKIKPIKEEEPMSTVPVQIVTCLCNFLEYFIKSKNSIPIHDKKEVWLKKLNFCFGFAYIWAFGASFKQTVSRQLDNMMRDFFGKLHIPMSETVFEYYFSEKELRFQHWNKIVPAFEYDPKLPFFSLLVPTVDTVRYTTLLEMLVSINKAVFFTGNTGVGKSIIVQKYLSLNQEKQNLAPIMLTFSAQTNSNTTQQTIEAKLEKKRGKEVIGSKGTSTCVIFVDDVNMPMVEKYGAQPPIELLRQLLDTKGFYDRPQFYWKTIEKFIVICAAAPPGGGRSALTPRFMRHFHILNIPDPSEDSMRVIFENIIKEFLHQNHFSDSVRKCGSIAVSSTIDMYTQITKGLLPIPSKFHYTFNLRDVAKVFQGMLMTKTVSVPNADVFTRLWIHECSRVFNDRLINDEDRQFFRDQVGDLLKSKFKVNWKVEDLFSGRGQIIFSMLLRLDAEEKLYEEIQDKNKLFKTLEDKMTDYNISIPTKMDLVFFEDAINHICRISRILRQPRGNAMLIGVSGCGKQSLTRLSSFMLEYGIFQIKLSKNYKPVHFREDLKVQMLNAGCDAIPSTFLITDNQIMYETFLEDINNILNTGEITNLYVKEDTDRMQNSLEKVVQQMKRPPTKDYIYQTYIERVRDNFHIILCMSPVGDQLRIRCRKFPSLVNCCTLDWFDNWPEEALLNVSKKFLTNVENVSEETKYKLSNMFMKVHKSVEHMSDRFYDELRRKVYITPKSYLDGINMYLNQLAEKRKEFKENIFRLSNGVQKLKTTNEQIAGLQVNLGVLIPRLEEENKNANIKAIQIRENKQIASQKEAIVEEESAIVQSEAIKIDQMRQENEIELAKCRPALEEAERAIAELKKDDITELKTFQNPPAAVVLALRCVFTYLGHQVKAEFEWNWAKTILSDLRFLDKIKGYDNKNIAQPILTKVKAMLQNDQFNPAEMSVKSKVAGGLAKWCKATAEYADAWKVVKPREQKQRELQEKLKIAEEEVAQKKAELNRIKQEIAQMEADYSNIQAYIEKLKEDKVTCERRLENADKLIGLLGNEGERWLVTVEELNKEAEKLIGNVFIAASSISYMGPFTGLYRDILIESWTKLCAENKIPVSDKYSLVYTLGNPIDIRNWNLCSLPSDSVSIDNGILSTKTQRWPLMIDPQTQANTWIKKMFKDHGLKVIKLTEGHSYQKEMESAIMTGATVLIEDVQEELDPGLDSILTKSIYKDEGLQKINFGDRPIIYDNRFKLFITTKLPNPHFLPEICIKLTVINFTVTFDGLEEQLRADVVINEAPEVERKRDTLVIQISTSKNELKRLENKILKDLAESNQDTILDNVELIKTLETSKEQSVLIAESLIQAEAVEVTINETRNLYKDVSIRGSILYFVISDLAGIDPMYQNSLVYVKKLFNDAIVATPPCEELSERIEALKNSITKTLYINICRGLFEAHKLIFSFLICTSIKRQAKLIDEVCWNYLLRGAGIFNKQDQPPRPEGSHHFLPESNWDLAYCLEQNGGDAFAGLCQKVKDNVEEFENYVLNEDENYLENIPCGYSKKLKPFEILVLLKIFKPEKLMFAFQKYVELELGKLYAESPIATMDSLFGDSDKKTPIIFVLSSGADPTYEVIQFAHKMNFYERFVYKSLGQGQELQATEMIERGKKEGNWVLLQNCHLFKSWMPTLEAICERFREEEHLIHEDFRLIMTSMPADYFPAAILQNGLKMTTEPPRGIKANLKRSYNNLINEETYASCVPTKENVDNEAAFKRLLFGLCFFHANVQERRKFGPLGWNIRYEFNDSDLVTSITMLRNFLVDNEDIPWDAMKFMTGQINYGGRVTDDWDRILLLNILQKYYTDEILTEGYQFSQSGVYMVPTHNTLLEIQNYIENLPQTEEPEVFGMHQNANISFQSQESDKIILTILNVQPRMVTAKGGKSSDEIIYEQAEELEANLPPIIDKEEHAKDIFKPQSKGLLHCLSTVLLQEIERYNRLLTKMGTSLSSLMKAIQGLVIMSPELDLMYTSLLKNQVPPNWAEVAYPSIKSLASWIKDLSLRVEFMRNWLKGGHPATYWLSGFFFPHGFMTGTLQTFARKHQKAIDHLQFRFKVLQQVHPEEIQKGPDDGIYVYGLFIEGARWSFEKECLEEQLPGEMISQMPIVHFLPKEINKKDAQGKQIDPDTDENDYKCPVYKTSVRAGVLSTTGQSTNFILAVDLPCSDNDTPDHWTLRGTALLTMLND